MSPSGSVTCQIFPGRQTNLAHLKICFQIVLETLSLPPLCSGVRTQLSEEDLLGEARVHQPDNMTSPTQLIFDYHGLDTGALCFVKDAGICPSILPGHTQDASQAALMVLFQDVKVSPIGRPGLRAIKEGRKHDSLVHKEYYYIHINKCYTCNFREMNLIKSENFRKIRIIRFVRRFIGKVFD